EVLPATFLATANWRSVLAASSSADGASAGMPWPGATSIASVMAESSPSVGSTALGQAIQVTTPAAMMAAMMARTIHHVFDMLGLQTGLRRVAHGPLWPAGEAAIGLF